MKSNSIMLQELFNEIQSMQAAHEEEKERQRRRLAWLEGRRRELYEVVAVNSSDYDTRRKLDDTEKEQHEIHGLMARSEAEHRTTIQEKRQSILIMRNDELSRLEQESKALRQRKAEIHTELLPEAQARVSSLREEEDRLVQRHEEIARRIRDLNQLELPTTQVTL